MDRFCVELAGCRGMRIALGLALQRSAKLTGFWNACKLFESAIEIRSAVFEDDFAQDLADRGSAHVLRGSVHRVSQAARRCRRLKVVLLNWIVERFVIFRCFGARLASGSCRR